MPSTARRHAQRFQRSTKTSSPLTRLTPLAVLIASAWSVPAFADTAATQTLPQVTVTGQAVEERADGPVQGYRATRSSTFTKTDTPLKDVPASVSVISTELIEDQGMRGLGDALRYVPGTTMGQGEGNRDQAVLRGINTTADFFIDGVRDDTQYFRDLYNVERVEVLKGPGGMAFGRGGAGGVVNRVSKRADFQSHSDVSFSTGSYGRVRGTADVGGKMAEGASWRLNAMAEKGDSFRDGVELKRYGFNPSVAFALSDRSLLTLSYEHFHDERTADRGIPSQNGRPYETARGTFFGNADQSVARVTVNGFSAVFDHAFGNGVQFRNTFRATDYDKFYSNVFASGAVDTSGNVKLAAYDHDVQRKNVFNQSDLVMKFNTGGLQHTLLTGIEFGHQNSTNLRTSGTVLPGTVAATSPFGTGTFTRTAGDANNRVKADMAAVYIQDQIALNSQWKVLAGLRYDHYKVSLDDQRAANTDLSRTDSKASPRLGLIWQPDARSTYYASYSYAFLPQGDQLSLATNTASLSPESAVNYEIGARWDVLPKLTLSAAAFRTDRKDMKVSHPTISGQLVQSGQQRTEGVELGLQGEVAKNWNIYAGYANLDARLTSETNDGSTKYAAGRVVGLVPKDAFSVWNKFDLAGGWGLGLGVIHQSAVYTTFTNAVKLPAFTRADGAVYYKLDNKTRIALNVENLFDKKYYPTAHNDNNISPGAPRSAMLTVSTRF